ncbi:condensation domain-containing protein [Klebsiella variicola]|uniref:condensation domain-containing protein n=1 Tax=Klebsiella variicola TaxID=244366 RepID=UPI00103498D6|nr:condensation domain-containing protein [Klebsiella variicola]
MKVDVTPFQYHVLNCEKIYLAGQRNIAILYDLPRDVNELQIKLAALNIFKLFPVLNTTFVKFEDDWKGVLGEYNEAVRYLEIECSIEESIMEVASKLFHSHNMSLNISKGPLSFFALIKKKGGKNLLFIGNHMTYDMISLQIIESTFFRLLYGKTNMFPQCNYLEWAKQISIYFEETFPNDIPRWIEQNWEDTTRIPVLDNQAPSSATQERWKYLFPLSVSQYYLSLVGGGVQLIDILLVRLHQAVCAFTSASDMVVELWDNGRESLRYRHSVGPFATFWPFLMEYPSGELLDSAKRVAAKRTAAPSKHGFLLGCFKRNRTNAIKFFQNVPEPQFKIDFTGYFTSEVRNLNKLKRIAKVKKLIPVDHSSYTHISLVFSVVDGIINMDWSHSSFAYQKRYLQEIARYMTTSPDLFY